MYTIYTIYNVPNGTHVMGVDKYESAKRHISVTHLSKYIINNIVDYILCVGVNI